MVKPKCNESGCKSNAVWKEDKCLRHGGGPRCKESGCTKSALTKDGNCRRHGGGPRCIEPGCKKAARTKICNKCASHGGGKKCKESGCVNTVAGKTDKCKSHGGGRRCAEPDCKRSAVGTSKKCTTHGGGKRCIEYGCKKGAAGITDKCAKHGGGRRCIEPNCTNGADNKSNKCRKHGGGPRCPNCITWIDSRSGSHRYDGYCATCFKQIFPDDERSKVVYIHTKEMRVRNRINETFEGFVHDKPLYTGECNCTHRRRIDHRKLINGTLLCVETDEFAHSGYDPKDEKVRYDDLFMIHSSKWIFIRFNPDGKGVDIEDKLDKLIEVMNEQIERIERDENKELVEIIKLFY